MKNFALIGAAGFVAPKHLKAIKDTDHQLVAAIDPHDAVGVLDSYFPASRFFTEIERFDRHLEKLRMEGEGQAVEYVSICSPNYLHDAHTRLALRVGAHAICEKPLVINPWNLDQLAAVEQATPGRVYNVLQLRLHPAVQTLKQQWQNESPADKRDIVLTYVTRRGRWYESSWKGSQERSGGVAMNIGIHFFDMLIHLAGPVMQSDVHLRDVDRMAGFMELETARVRWFLSINENDLPDEVRAQGGYAYRSIRSDGEEIDLSAGFTDLHTRVYENILSGGGFGIEDARPGIDAVYNIRHADVTDAPSFAHPKLA